jgi:hypothetical protein
MTKKIQDPNVKCVWILSLYDFFVIWILAFVIGDLPCPLEEKMEIKLCWPNLGLTSR